VPLITITGLFALGFTTNGPQPRIDQNFQTSKPVFHQNQFGGTLGGPLWRNHTFFFMSYRERRSVVDLVQRQDDILCSVGSKPGLAMLT